MVRDIPLLQALLFYPALFINAAALLLVHLGDYE